MLSLGKESFANPGAIYSLKSGSGLTFRRRKGYAGALLEHQEGAAPRHGALQSLGLLQRGKGTQLVPGEG